MSFVTTNTVTDVSVVESEFVFPSFNDNDSLSLASKSPTPPPSSFTEMLRPLSREQKQAGTQIINYFYANSLLNRWAILTAQMQSGKTEAYLFIAAEMLRLGRVQNFVIFSGNSETALKQQIVDILTDNFPEERYTEEERDQKSFERKYTDYLLESVSLTPRQILDTLRTFRTKGKTAVVWGNGLSKYSGPTENTLFIWEESHFAQDQDNLPAKMLQRIGISADGDVSVLRSNGNYVVSVSATGFSELSDNHHHMQGKLVQNLEPGAGYNSVEKMMEGGRIKSYKTVDEGLARALSMERVGKKYAVIRVTIKNETVVANTCRLNKWHVVSHDSTTESGEGLRAWKNMKNAPLVDTVILLKGLCRMGQNIEKTHLLFCFETSKNSKTDTVLQSFVGRACGYSTNSENVHVYIPEKTFKNGEIGRYIRMSGGEKVMPLQARNLAPLKEVVPENGLFPIIPLIIEPSNRFSNDNDENSAIIADVKEHIKTNAYTNLNRNQQVVDATIKTLMEAHNIVGQHDVVITVRRIEKKHRDGVDDTKKRYNISQADMVANFKTSIDTNTPLKFSTIRNGSVKQKDGTSKQKDISKHVNIWVMGNGYMYIDFLATNEERLNDMTTSSKIARTTQKEVFCHKLEDGTEQLTNGAFSIHLSPMSANFVDKMNLELSEIIKVSLSLTLVTNTRKIASVKDSTHKGISLSAQVLASLQPGGSIFTHIKTTHGVELKITKTKTALSKSHNVLGLVRIASISW